MTKVKVDKSKWRDILLISAGVLGLVIFAFYYPSVHPYSGIKVQLGEDEIDNRIEHMLEMNGYRSEIYSLNAEFQRNPSLLNEIQNALGRQETVEWLHQGGMGQLPVFYWNVELNREGAQSRDIVIGDQEETETSELEVQMTQRGKWIAFENDDNILPSDLVDEGALQLKRPFDPAVNDSLFSRLLHFDLGARKNFQDTLLTLTAFPSEQLRKYVQNRQHYSLTSHNAVTIARYHLGGFIWEPDSFRVDTLYPRQTKDIESARVVFKRKKPVAKQQVAIQVDIASTGALLGVQPRFESIGSQQQTSGATDWWEVIRIGLLILLSFIVLILFYRRLRAKAIDTKSALITALLFGLLLPLQLILMLSKEVSQGGMESIIEVAVMFVVVVGFTGAFGGMLFFLLSGTGESLTRQVWPRKLKVYDLLRQGLFLNKPAGTTLLWSSNMAFVLAGVWTSILWFLPDLPITFSSGPGSTLFYSGMVFWPILYVFSKEVWVSVASAMLLYPIFGSALQYKYQNKWLTLGGLTGALPLLPLFPIDLGPNFAGLMAALIIGALLAYTFLRWDVITVILTFFLFRLLINTVEGWIPTGSPDIQVFGLIVGVFIAFLAVGLWAYRSGPEEQGLPDFVPDYIEEMTRNQRIQQELEIAKNVQNSFLPVEFPGREKLDISAFCIPAYETGGDYYDFFELDGQRLGIAIGDVSGKGIEAAFYMTFVKGALQSLCHEVISPAEVLKRTNRIFYNNAPRGIFISLIYGVMDTAEEKFHVARAGHNPILKFNRDNGEINRLQPKGMGIGLDNGDKFDATIEEYSLTMKTGDTVVLFTDGVVEAVNAAGETYELDQMERVIKKMHTLPAGQIVNSVSEDLADFIGTEQQFDDMTLVVIKNTG